MRLRWTLALAAAALLVGTLVLAFATTDSLRAFGGTLEGERLERARRSPRFVDGRFVNALPTNMTEPGSALQLIWRQLAGTEQRVPLAPVPVVARTAADYAAAPDGVRATWIGHATVLLEIDGRRVLTDPIWSERCSPSSLVGPVRFFPPPLPLDALPPIDAVVISHDHYDHLDEATIQALAQRGTRFAVPLGIGAHLDAWSVPGAQITELDWGESLELPGLTLTATPARHYSGRNPLHGDSTLWASWVIRGPAHRAFFSGDSGYFDGFRAIGAEHGPFDLTLIKIGASDPLWEEIHMSPEHAVRTHQDLGGRLMLPVHWGTFNLAYHAWNEPAERAVSAARAAGVTLVVPRPGELVDAARPPPVETWWR